MANPQIGKDIRRALLTAKGISRSVGMAGGGTPDYTVQPYPAPAAEPLRQAMHRFHQQRMSHFQPSPVQSVAPGQKSRAELVAAPPMPPPKPQSLGEEMKDASNLGDTIQTGYDMIHGKGDSAANERDLINNRSDPYATGDPGIHGDPHLMRPNGNYSSSDGGDNGGFLNALRGFESGNSNIPNTHQMTNSGQAQGYYQITTGTWREFAPKAGIDLNQYPTALSAPFDVQHQVAMNIPYSRYDPITIRKMEGAGFRVQPKDLRLTLGELSQRFGDQAPMPAVVERQSLPPVQTAGPVASSPRVPPDPNRTGHGNPVTFNGHPSASPMGPTTGPTTSSVPAAPAWKLPETTHDVPYSRQRLDLGDYDAPGTIYHGGPPAPPLPAPNEAPPRVSPLQNRAEAGLQASADLPSDNEIASLGPPDNQQRQSPPEPPNSDQGWIDPMNIQNSAKGGLIRKALKVARQARAAGGGSTTGSSPFLTGPHNSVLYNLIGEQIKQLHPGQGPGGFGPQNPQASDVALLAGLMQQAQDPTQSPTPTSPNIVNTPYNPPPPPQTYTPPDRPSSGPNMPHYNNTLDQVLGTNHPTMQQMFGFNYPQIPPPQPNIFAQPEATLGPSGQYIAPSGGSSDAAVNTINQGSFLGGGEGLTPTGSPPNLINPRPIQTINGVPSIMPPLVASGTVGNYSNFNPNGLSSNEVPMAHPWDNGVGMPLAAARGGHIVDAALRVARKARSVGGGNFHWSEGHAHGMAGLGKSRGKNEDYYSGYAAGRDKYLSRDPEAIKKRTEGIVNSYGKSTYGIRG